MTESKDMLSHMRAMGPILRPKERRTMKAGSQQLGASEERKCIRRKLLREIGAAHVDASNASGYEEAVHCAVADALEKIVEWIDRRTDRFDRKPGGLGRKRVGG